MRSRKSLQTRYFSCVAPKIHLFKVPRPLVDGDVMDQPIANGEVREEQLNAADLIGIPTL